MQGEVVMSSLSNSQVSEEFRPSSREASPGVSTGHGSRLSRVLRYFTVWAVVVLAGVVAAQAVPLRPAAVQVRFDPVLGEVLTTPDGSTLYTFSPGRGQNPNCTGECLANFELFSETADGRSVYVSRLDSRPGDTNGQRGNGPWIVANAGPTVRVFDHPVLGEILVGPTGMTLYTFANDRTDDLVCEDGCSENWPPLVVSRRPVVPPGLEDRVDLVLRGPDEHRPARIQVTYRGRPLYYWSRDSQPGDVKGQGMAGLWSVAKP